MIDKKRLQENIIYFGKLKNLKIGEIEKEIGVRLGLISRWANKQPKNVSLEVVNNIANLLDVTIDDLINTNVDKLKKEQEITELKIRLEELSNELGSDKE